MSLTATHSNGSGPVPAAAATAATNCFNMKHLESLVKDEVMNYYADFAPKLNAGKPPMGPTANANATRNTFAKNSSFGSIDLEKNEKRVLVIYSGGTIGMSRGPNGSLVCSPRMLEKTVRRFPHMHDEEYAKERFGEGAENAPLCLP